jgi:hypothetical protein
MAEKAVWDKTTVKHFCDICRDEVLAGHRPLGHFKLRDEEFDKCDEDEDYMPEAAQATAQPQGDDALEEENEVTMNTIRDRITNALLIARAT